MRTHPEGGGGERVFTVDWVSEGPAATTGDGRGKVEVIGVADPKPLAPEAEPGASPLQALVLAQTQPKVRASARPPELQPRQGTRRLNTCC